MATPERFIVSRVPVGNSKCEFLVYDIYKRSVIPEISSYAQALSREKMCTRLTIEQGLAEILEFWRFLTDRESHLGSVSDSVVKEFRDRCLDKVRKAPAHRGNENHAKATVNHKLYRIYDWIIWLEMMRMVPVGTIGRKGLVSTLVDLTTRRPSREDRGLVWGRKYPLIYKVANSNSKHSAPTAVTTDASVAALFAHFISRYDAYIARRNILFADIAEAAGFRRGSICSLCVDQFELEAVSTAVGEFLVRPRRQKFNYTRTFGISLSLAYRVREYIDSHLLPFIAAKKIPESVHQNRLFLSSKTGKPITDRAMTRVISAGFREIGFDKGVGVHSLRGKFASDLTDHELLERQALGLDTSNMSIAAAVAMKMGHNDPSQFYRYASATQARQARIRSEGRSAELIRLRAENEELKREIDTRNRLIPKGSS